MAWLATAAGTVGLLLATWLATWAGPAQAQTLVESHALSEFAVPELPADFPHYAYADPDAPKGGEIRLASTGGFDSLNPIPLQGESARSIGLVYDTLMSGSQRELGVFYPLVAERVSYLDDGSEITFHLNPDARFHDGHPVTADDVAWSFDQIMAHGQPFLKSLFDGVETVEVIDDRTIRFTFTTRAMKPLTRVAESISILPQHYWEEEGADRDISAAFLDPPLGSGPYRLVEVDAGRQLVYERVADYWGADLPVNVGHWNFDRVEIDYFGDRTIMFQAFTAGEYDYHHSFSSREWGAGFDFPAFEQGLVVKEDIPSRSFRGMQGFFFNTRLDRFSDARVREAITLLYPFEWVRETLMYGFYERMESWFPNSDWAATGLPEGRELDLLEPYREQLDPRVFEAEIDLPGGGAQENVDRGALRTAMRLFEEAGFEIRDGTMVDAQTGEAFTLEILLRSSALEPHTQPLLRNLERIGVAGTIRLVDSAQFQRRYQDRAFEVISFAYTFFPPPGSEEANRFGSEAAATDGSANVAGVADPVVDAMLAAMIETDDPDEKRAAARALDRVLMWGFYAVPHWYNDVAWIAHWDLYGRPDSDNLLSYGLPNSIGFQPTWWWDEAAAAAVEAAR